MLNIISLTLTIITFTVVKVSRISRLEMVCKKKPYDGSKPAVELVYIVEKHNTLTTINCMRKLTCVVGGDY